MGVFYSKAAHTTREISRTVHVEGAREGPPESTAEEVQVRDTPEHLKYYANAKIILCNEHKVPPHDCFAAHWPQAFSGREHNWDAASKDVG